MPTEKQILAKLGKDWLAHIGAEAKSLADQELPSAWVVHTVADPRIILESKLNCLRPYTHTEITDLNEVTIDWKLWTAIYAAQRPHRLAILHKSGIFLHRALDLRDMTPGDRPGGVGGRRRLAWFRWSDFDQVWPLSDPDPGPKAPPDDNTVLSIFGSNGEGDT